MGKPHLHLLRGPWAEPGTQEARSCRWWTGEGGVGSPRVWSGVGGGWSRAGSLGPISPSLRLRRLRPRLRPRGGDRGSHHPSRPQDWGLQTPASDPGPTVPSPDPNAPRAAQEAVAREDSPAASPLCGRLARTSAGGVGGGSGEGAPPPPQRSAVELTWLSVLPAPPSRRWCRGAASAG